MSERIPEPTLRAPNIESSAIDIYRFQRDVAAMFDRYPAEATITFGSESANVIRFTVKVFDRRRKSTVGPWAVHLWVSDSDSLVPGGTQTVSFVTGTVLNTHDPNVRWDVLTDQEGTIVLDVSVSGAGTRRVAALVYPAVQSSAQATWA